MHLIIIRLSSDIWCTKYYSLLLGGCWLVSWFCVTPRSWELHCFWPVLNLWRQFGEKTHKTTPNSSTAWGTAAHAGHSIPWIQQILFAPPFNKGNELLEEMGLQTQVWARAQQGVLNMFEKCPKPPWLLPINQTRPNPVPSYFHCHCFPSTSPLAHPPTCSPAKTQVPGLIFKPIFIAELKWGGGQAHRSMKVTH